MLKSRSIVSLSLMSAVLCLMTMLGLGTAASASPYFLIDSQTEWLAAQSAAQIQPMMPAEWSDYMLQWAMYKVEGDPYPINSFLPPELYVWGGGGGGGTGPEDAGLVMKWGDPTTPPGSYSSAWKFIYLLDPDLTGCTINIQVTAPQFNPTGSQINNVSFGIQDINNNIRSWHWQVGPGTSIPWNTPTNITINPMILSVNATTPVASGFANNPFFNIVNSAQFIVDENAKWVASQGIPPPGQQIPAMWNYWHNLMVTPPIQQKPPLVTKWSQPPVEFIPGLQPPIFNGWDERSLYYQRPICADDWLCEDNRPVTDIHWWGSFIGWTQPDPPPMPSAFHIGIWTDVPKGPNNAFSHPGTLLWENFCDTYEWNFAGYDKDPRGQFENETCFQFNQYLKPNEYFYQNPGQGIYWLSIAAIYTATPQYPWGWKTRPHFFQDDGVRITQTMAPAGGNVWPPVLGSTWATGSPIEYPSGVSWDLAFELSTIEQQDERDWGDAPDPTYPTFSASAGANHKIVQGFSLGKLEDAEADGQPNPTAMGDDIANLPDEDGLLLPLPLLMPGQITTINVTLTNSIGSAGFLDAWIDFNGDGSWATPGDQIAFAQPLAVGPNPVTFAVRRTWSSEMIQTFARFRLSSVGGLPFTGPANDGEVEDHAVRIEPDRGTLRFSRNITLKDHFWWPRNPDQYNEMVSLTVAADAVEAVKWDSLDVQLTGGALGDVAKVSVWQDVDGNGDVGPIDTWLGAVPSPFGLVTVSFGAPPVIPAGGSIKALVAYEMSAAGALGTIYTCQATAAAGTGQTSLQPAHISGLPISSCRKIRAPGPISIGEAKKLTIGQLFLLIGKEVTANFLGTSMNLFYIEEEDRSSGIGVSSTMAMAPVSIGDKVSVLGTCVLLNGTELIVSPQQILIGANMLPYLTPVGMNNKWTGGGIFGGQPAVYDQALPLPGTQSLGLNSVGMLVRTWGLVTYHNSAFSTPSIGGPMFWINDGSDLRDGFWLPMGGRTLGVACLYLGPMGVFPNPGEYWGVTGIMRSIPNTNLIPQAVRLLVPRSYPSDLTQYPMPP